MKLEGNNWLFTPSWTDFARFRRGFRFQVSLRCLVYCSAFGKHRLACVIGKLNNGAVASDKPVSYAPSLLYPGSHICTVLTHKVIIVLLNHNDNWPGGERFHPWLVGPTADACPTKENSIEFKFDLNTFVYTFSHIYPITKKFCTFQDNAKFLLIGPAFFKLTISKTHFI